MKHVIRLVVVLAMVASAQAAPNIANTTQKGSLLIFPDIDVRGSVSTLVRIQNDQNSGTWVKCYFLDQAKQRNDFTFLVTRGQPVWFDAFTGAGTVGANPFPAGIGAGMLVCWAVDENEAPLKWNHLSGTATVVDYDTGTAYEYSAWAFYATPANQASLLQLIDLAAVTNPKCDVTDPKCAPVAGLPLTGAAGYDKCPATLVGQLSPEGAVLGDEGGKDLAEFGQTRVTLVGCNIDLRQNYYRFDTKYSVDVWNENELKLTGAHDCADGWHETYLTSMKAQGDNFSLGDLKTDAARYRVTPTKDDFICAPTRTHKVGVVGVQAAEVSLTGGLAKAGTTLTAVGSYPGFVLYDVAGAVPDETFCGDGIVGGSEACDDGNTTSGDGCSATCSVEATCGNGILELGEEFDPPPGPFTSAPVDAVTCRFDFSSVQQLYCNGTCSWAGATSCDQADADVFCKLKTGNPNSTATSFSLPTALAAPGFACADPANLGTLVGPLPGRGVTIGVRYQDSSILANHGPGTVIANVVCTNP